VRQRIYVIGFGIVALSVLSGLLVTLATLVGLKWAFFPVFRLSELFSHPVPPMLRAFLPRIVSVVLYWAFVALILRRLWLFLRLRSVESPASFTRIPYVLTYISVVCVVLFAGGLLLSIVIKAGSGVPAAMLSIPAVILLAPVMAWVELRSLSFKRPQSA